MGAWLFITTSQPTPVADNVVFEMVQLQISSAIAIPMSKVMLQSTKACWEKPALVPNSNKRLYHMYHTQEDSAEFFLKHPQPNSIVVSSSSKSRRHYSTPLDREGKKINSYGCRLYSTGALGIKSCNYVACISQYSLSLKI